MSVTSNINLLLTELDKEIKVVPNGTVEGNISNDVPWAFFWEVGWTHIHSGKYHPPENMLRKHVDQGMNENVTKKIVRSVVSTNTFFKASYLYGMVNETLSQAIKLAIANTRGTRMVFGGSTTRIYKPNHVRSLGYPSTSMNKFKGWHMSKAQRADL